MCQLQTVSAGCNVHVAKAWLCSPGAAIHGNTGRFAEDLLVRAPAALMDASVSLAAFWMVSERAAVQQGQSAGTVRRQAGCGGRADGSRCIVRHPLTSNGTS